MTKKHFQMLADTILTVRQQHADSQDAQTVLLDVALALTDRLRDENPRFDGAKFLKAMGF